MRKILLFTALAAIILFSCQNNVPSKKGNTYQYTIENLEGETWWPGVIAHAHRFPLTLVCMGTEPSWWIINEHA